MLSRESKFAELDLDSCCAPDSFSESGSIICDDLTLLNSLLLWLSTISSSYCISSITPLFRIWMLLSKSTFDREDTCFSSFSGVISSKLGEFLSSLLYTCFNAYRVGSDDEIDFWIRRS